MRACGNCGETGHNRRTCKKGKKEQQVRSKKKRSLAKTKTARKKGKKKKKSARKCGVCEEPGHDARNCPNKAAVTRRRNKAEKEAAERAKTEQELAEKPYIVLPHMVRPGGNFWAPFGDKGWSAVTINSVSRLWCKATRVKPSTGGVVTTGSKVRRDELIKRNPDMEGRDKPTDPASVVFKDAREYREKERIAKEARAFEKQIADSRIVADADKKIVKYSDPPKTNFDLRKSWVKFWTEECGYTTEQADAKWEAVPTDDDW